MTARCEPPPHLRDRDGWHWVENDAREPVVVKWEDPCWKVSGMYFMPEEMAEAGNSYLAPVPSPDTVAALCEAVQRVLDRIHSDVTMGGCIVTGRFNRGTLAGHTAQGDVDALRTALSRVTGEPT